MRLIVCSVLLVSAVVACATNDTKVPDSTAATATAVRRDSVKEGFIEVPGGKVWYRIVGADKPGIPLLTLHGGPGMPSYYLSPLAELADERPVIFFDQLGCGRSDHPNDTTLWTIPRFVEEVKAVRQALGYEEVHLLGHSWGTLLAFEYLLTKPAGVKSVIMSGPAISIVRFRHDVDSMIAMLPDSLIRAIRTNEKAGTITAPAYLAASQVFYDRHVIRTKPLPADVESTFKYIGTQVYNTMNGPTEFTVVGSFKNYDGTPRLGELTLPVLWVAGEFDETSPAAAKDFQRMVKGSEYVEVKGAGHLTMWDARGEYLTAVRKFLTARER
ncbi:MAG: proline iminopeptidase-family hydrolase [Gemmatimonadaceae bacterium]|nr:proline iminopeptidase-family hydrolase [Gemmatimonadaceae bacterium]